MATPLTKIRRCCTCISTAKSRARSSADGSVQDAWTSDSVFSKTWGALWAWSSSNLPKSSRPAFASASSSAGCSWRCCSSPEAAATAAVPSASICWWRRSHSWAEGSRLESPTSIAAALSCRGRIVSKRCSASAACAPSPRATRALASSRNASSWPGHRAEACRALSKALGRSSDSRSAVAKSARTAARPSRPPGPSPGCSSARRRSSAACGARRSFRAVRPSSARELDGALRTRQRGTGGSPRPKLRQPWWGGLRGASVAQRTP
mmetsp:Transcript_64231/g.191435  ORF Transcript_64231/g.191435 Transcript_64231/m.191435 type:complete len:265 (-) Transcript_64231:7-801(-)